jgi:hypothetical protein
MRESGKKRIGSESDEGRGEAGGYNVGGYSKRGIEKNGQFRG